MPNYRHSAFRGRSGQRRKTQWIGSADVTAVTTVAGGSARLDQTLTTAELALRPFTIVRTVGVVMVKSDQITAIEDAYAAFGGCVVSENAVAIGVTAVPLPIGDEGSDLWFMYETAMCSFVFGDGTGFVSPGGYSKYFDSRAARKVQDGEDIAFVMEVGSGVGLSFYWKFRMLVKLH